MTRQPGNRLSVPTSGYSNTTSPITYHESFCLVNNGKEQREKGFEGGCAVVIHTLSHTVHVCTYTCAQAPARLCMDSVTFSAMFPFLHFYSAAAYITSSNPYRVDVNFTAHIHLKQEYGRILQWRNTLLLAALCHSSDLKQTHASQQTFTFS